MSQQHQTSASDSALLENVNFLLPVRESVQMHWDRLHPTKLVIQTLSKHWEEKRKKVVQNLIKAHTTIDDPDKIDKQVIDEHTHELIPKYTKQYCTVTNLDHNDYQHCVKRINYASTVANNMIWVHGGSNGKKPLSDFWCYEPQTNQITLFQHVCSHNVAPIPAMENHHLIPVSNKSGKQDLVVLGHVSGDDMRAFYISRIDDFDNICFGKKLDFHEPVYEQNEDYDARPSRYNEITTFIHPVPDNKSSKLPAREDFTPVVISNDTCIIVFGGRCKGSGPATDTLYKVYLNQNGTRFEPTSPSSTFGFRELAQRSNVWPSARYGYAAVPIYQNMLLFGGRNGEKFYNDLYLFDSDTETWTEIDIQGSVPPGLAFSSAFSYISQSVYISGGISEYGVSDSIYCLDIGNKTWNALKVTGYGYSVNSAPHDIQIPSYGSNCHVVDTIVYRIGGRTKGNKFISDLGCLYNIHDPGHDYMLPEFLRKIRKDQTLSDVVFRVKKNLDSDDDDLRQFPAHKCVIFARCPFLYNLIEESIEITNNGDTDVLSARSTTYVDVPDCSAAVFDAYLRYLYCGEVVLSSLEYIQQLINVTTKWSPSVHGPVISDICRKRACLDTVETIINRLESDCEKLLNNESSCADLYLHTSDGGIIAVHKTLLIRSDYFKTMLQSGLQESYADSIEIEYPKDVIMEIVRYCYSDKVKINASNAIGLLMASTTYHLRKISLCCRNLVGHSLTVENVCHVTQIAETYQDNALKRVCLGFIRDHFEVVSGRSAFHDLSKETQYKALELAEKKKKQQSKKH